MAPSFVSLVYFFLCLYFPLASASNSISITGQSQYNELRGCAKNCLWGFPVKGDLPTRLGCTSPYLDQCFCRADAPARASSILSDCVTSACTDIKTPTVDVSSAIAVYDGYCATAVGGPASNIAQTTAEPTGTVTSMNLGTVSSPGATAYSTQPNGVVVYNNIQQTGGNQNVNTNQISKGGSSSSFSRGAIAGITIAGIIVSTVVGFVGLRYVLKRRKIKNENPPLPWSPQDTLPPMAEIAGDHSHPHRPELDG